MATNKTRIITVRAKPQTVAVWRAAAAHQDVTLSELLRDAADHYSHQLLTSKDPSRGRDPADVQAG